MENKEHPEAYDTVRIYLKEGRKIHATWTGKVWWAEGAEVMPETIEKWEPMAPLGMSYGAKKGERAPDR